MKLAIYTIHKTLFAGDAQKLILRTSQGQITVLDHHVPLISLVSGPAAEVVDAAGATTLVPLQSGFLEVRPESDVVILAAV